MSSKKETNQDPSASRRKVIKSAAWSAPVIAAVSLPKHAQATEVEETTEAPEETTPEVTTTLA